MEKMSFEDALKTLEEIVRKLESGQASLDESLELYTESIQLVKYCNSKLDNVEKKIMKINREITGEGENGKADDVE